MNKHPIVVVAGTLLADIVIVVLAIVLALGPEIEEDRLRCSVWEGHSRRGAIKVLSQKAWYYQPCDGRYPNVATDLFFYGSHRYDRATIIIAHYVVSRDGEAQVSTITDCSSPDWQVLFGDCIDRSRFED